MEIFIQTYLTSPIFTIHYERKMIEYAVSFLYPQIVDVTYLFTISFIISLFEGILIPIIFAFDKNFFFNLKFFVYILFTCI